MLKVGETIKCHDAEDLRKWFERLNNEGYHAVRDTGDGYRIRITDNRDVHEEYMVSARNQYGGADCYYSTLEEAKEAAEEMGAAYEFVEIRKRYLGEWELVSRSWQTEGEAADGIEEH